MVVHTEKQVEQYLGKKMKSIGAIDFKFVSPGKAGVPDRLFVLPDGSVIFVEVKCAKGRLAPLQKYWIEKLNKQGTLATVVSNYAEVDLLLKEMRF